MKKEKCYLSISSKSVLFASMMAITAAGLPLNAGATKTDGSKIEFSQQKGKRVTVTVTDQSGPLIGANVLVKGTTIGNVTDANGVVTLDVPANAVLQITYIGYNP